MKKPVLLTVPVLAGSVLPASAATGSAADGMYLVLILAVLLLLITGTGPLIHFLLHPPRAVRLFLKRLFRTIRSWFAFSSRLPHHSTLPAPN